MSWRRYLPTARNTLLHRAHRFHRPACGKQQQRLLPLILARIGKTHLSMTAQTRKALRRQAAPPLLYYSNAERRKMSPEQSDQTYLFQYLSLLYGDCKGPGVPKRADISNGG